MNTLELHLFSRTQHRFFVSDCDFTVVLHVFGLYLGHNQACQYKYIIKEDKIKSKGHIIYGHKYVIMLKQNIKYKYKGLK